MIKKGQKKIYFINNSNLDKIKKNNKYEYYTTLDRVAEKQIIKKSINYINIDNYLIGKNVKLSFKDNLKILKLAKQMDKIISGDKYYFFSNYYKLLSGIRLIENDIRKIEILIKKNINNKIFIYISTNIKKNYEDRFYLIFKEFNKKYKNIYFIKTSNVLNEKRFNPLPIQEDLSLNFQQRVKFFLKKKHQIFQTTKKKNVLFYLTDKLEQDYIKKKLYNFNFFNYEYFVKYNQKFSKLNKRKLNDIYNLLRNKKFKCPTIYTKYFENIFNELNLFYNINKFEIKKFLSKNNIDIFITSHPTLISNTIKIECINQKIPTLTLMHGGNFGHFSNVVPYPQFTACNTLKNNPFNYFQVYTDKMKEKIVKKNFYTNKKEFNNQIVKIKSIKFHNLKFENDLLHSKKYLRIGYMCRAKLNVTSSSYAKFQNTLNMYNNRNELLCRIQSHRNVFLNISTYDREQISDFGESKLIKKLDKNNQINFEILNGKKIIERSDVVIFEQFSTLLIEAIYSKKPLIYLNNPYLKLFEDQKKLLKKQVYFIESNSQFKNLLKSLMINKKNNKFFNKTFSNKFIQNYYISKTAKSADKLILNILNKSELK